MKKFILKIVLFVSPFFISYFINLVSFEENDGDLIRMSYLYQNPSIKSDVASGFALQKKYKSLKELDFLSSVRFDVVTIGDSFSDQGNLSYLNFLANKDVSVLNIDRFKIDDNPIEKLVQLINSDFFDNFETKYVVLQSVERSFVQRCELTNFNRSINVDSLILNFKSVEKKQNTVSFFSSSTVKGPLANYMFNFSINLPFTNTYRVKTISDNLFSKGPDNLLFYQKDLNYLNFKNNSLKISACNEKLNYISKRLEEKEIKLILLIAPDKYDLYYPYIKDNSFEKPLFDEILRNLKRDYILLPAHRLLKKEIDKGVKDVYYYDDSHWSPVGARIVAEELAKIIN